MFERLEHAGVEGIRVGRFGSQINTTCVLYRVRDTLVDTGPSNQWRLVRRFLTEREVRQVVVTHHHEDHSGNLAQIASGQETRVYSPTDGVEALVRGFRLRLYQRVVWGRPGRVRAEPLPARVGGLQPIATPGHSTDMTCFLEPRRGWLFSGDLYIASRTRYLRRDEDVATQIASLREVLRHDFETLFCSHRGVVTDGKAALQAKLDFLVELCERVRHLRSTGLGRRAITRRLLGREDLTSLMTGLHFSKGNLIASCLEAVDAHAP